MRKNKWNLTLPISEARKNDEVISLADSQILRWLDELNNIYDANDIAISIKKEIKSLKKQSDSLQNRKTIKKLYQHLDEVQFKPDYISLIIDKEKDYHRANKGFKINGIQYERLLGTNGGVKNTTIVFISCRHAEEIKKRLNNGRDESKLLVPAKFEAYKSLPCSASIPVSMPNGILVIPDCEVQFLSDVVFINDELSDEPTMEYNPEALVDLNESDGYGLMLPALAQRWSDELGLDYLVGGVNTRYAWEKGMVFTFDFIEFADKVANKYIVKDAWGDEVDIRDVELILTTSMLKLWDSYSSLNDYLKNCDEHHYTFGIAKSCPEKLENERNLNYQFIQSYSLNDEDLHKLVAPTVNKFKDILHADAYKSILFGRGCSITEKSAVSGANDYNKALMIDQRVLDDPYVKSSIYHLIRQKINDAKVGIIQVHGNYSIVCGDPFALCQSIFGLEVTGILKQGEIYNNYWVDKPSDSLVCFRAPMTCHNNIRIVHPNRSDEALYWYRYMPACTLFNAWDTAAHALNGMDKDGDLVMLTDNDVLLRNTTPLPALMCVQRKANKILVTEEDLVQANIDSFGDDIGKTTNWITSMFEVQAGFEKDSEEYKELDYRIKCGQLFQQNSIDKAKGIIAKPMPRYWHDRHSVNQIEDLELRKFNQNIIADKKPYFMRIIYPALSKQYNTYIKNTNKSAMREFQLSISELLDIPTDKLTAQQSEFLKYYHYKMPVGVNDCVMNRICKIFENKFDGFVKMHSEDVVFDYNILKSNVEYSKTQYNAILKLYTEYNKRLRNYKIFTNYERISDDESRTRLADMKDEFIKACFIVSNNKFVVCDIIIDICYKRTSTKKFAWDICGDTIIENLLERNNHIMSFPSLDSSGNIEFNGLRFSAKQIDLKGEIE